MMALAMTFTDRETAVNMSFQRTYAEPYEWVKHNLSIGHCFLQPQPFTMKMSLTTVKKSFTDR